MFIDKNTLAILIIAILIDSIIGDPNWLWKWTGHPIALFAKFIDSCESFRVNSISPTAEKVFGFIVIVALILISILVGFILIYLLSESLIGILVCAIIASIFIAQKDLYDHVKQVYKALSKQNLSESRDCVAKIVGRDTAQLDEPGVVRAAIESTAENISDGIIAPVFWCLLFGLPGLLAYKAINTADSIIGYKNDRYINFGWATARLDDLVNYIPSRLSGFIISICAPIVNGKIRSAILTMFKDASKHNSPNAGWPEASMAGILGIALAGPRVYPTHKENGNWINAIGRKEVDSNDVNNALKILLTVCLLQLLIIGVFLLIYSLNLHAR